MILCPHCEEAGCAGSCRFRVRRRSFLALGLGALALVLPGDGHHEQEEDHIVEVLLRGFSGDDARAMALRIHG